MAIHLFMQGILFGFLIAVPVGPMSLLCVNRGLAGGLAYGLSSGLGVATADAMAAGVAALGLTLISSFLTSQQSWLRPLGAVFLCYLGFKVCTIRPDGGVVRSETAAESDLRGAFLSTLILNFTNPATILSFLAIYAGFGIHDLSGDYFTATLLVSGVFVGSALWWVLLAIGLLVCHGKFGERELKWVHRVSGVIIAGFGLAILINPFTS
jgi:threonine/homoserine/homoserine lactone efflux protein